MQRAQERPVEIWNTDSLRWRAVGSFCAFYWEPVLLVLWSHHTSFRARKWSGVAPIFLPSGSHR